MEKISTPMITVLMVFLTLFGYIKLAGPIPFSINSTTTTKSDSFVVNGNGKSFVKPDLAYVNVGIQAQSPSVKMTQEEINKIINNVSRAIKDLGVEEKDIKTTNYSINPSYDWSSSRQRITGYSANTTLRVTVREIDKINDVIDSATQNGANEIGNISFDVEDKTAAMEEARKEAVAEAKEKARQAANVAGFNLGKIINYSETTSSPNRPMYDMALKSMSVEEATPGTLLETGSSEINLTVSLSYEIR